MTSRNDDSNRPFPRPTGGRQDDPGRGSNERPDQAAERTAAEAARNNPDRTDGSLATGQENEHDSAAFRVFAAAVEVRLGTLGQQSQHPAPFDASKSPLGHTQIREWALSVEMRLKALAKQYTPLTAAPTQASRIDRDELRGWMQRVRAVLAELGQPMPDPVI